MFINGNASENCEKTFRRESRYDLPKGCLTTVQHISYFKSEKKLHFPSHSANIKNLPQKKTNVKIVLVLNTLTSCKYFLNFFLF